SAVRTTSQCRLLSFRQKPAYTTSNARPSPKARHNASSKAAAVSENPVRSSLILPNVFMKYEVGQVIKFSCVRNSAPPREIIHRITTAHPTIPGNVAPTSVARSFEDFCCSQRTKRRDKRVT